MSTKRQVLFLVTSILISSTLNAMSAFYCCDNDYAFGKTTFSARPQGNYYFTTLMATADITHHPQREQNYFNCTAILGYRQNMDSYELGRYFLTQTGPLIFGSVNTDVDIQNLQLGLAANYKGTLTMQPSVNDCIIDLDFFAGFDAWINGAWLRLNLPFARNSWCPCLQSQTAAVGSGRYPDGFADVATTHVPVTYQDCAQATCGDEALGLITPLDAGKLCCCKKTLWGLSDVHLELGYDFIRRERGNMGAALIGAIGTGQPTGKSCNSYLLAPTIGTQNSSQLGAALRGQYILFNFEDNKTITFFGDVRVSHIFPGCTKRLLNWNVGNSTAFNYWLLLNHYSYDGTYIDVSGTNLLNKKVKVSAAAMGEATIMIQTKRNNWHLALGYNFWGRSKEHIAIMDQTIGNASDYYAIKDTNYWGTRIIDKSVGNISEQPTNASKVASLENIKKYALLSGNIDVCTAQHPGTFSNTFFANAGYEFDNIRCNPYVGIGGHVEWGCGNIALNTWGIYLQGGISI